MMPSNLLLCQAAEQLEFAPLQQWSWMETCVDGPAMWIKPNVGKLPTLLLNFWKGWSAKAVVVPAPLPMSMQGLWQWCFPAGTYAEAARYILMSHCVHEKEATLVHAVTSQTHIKGMCKSYRYRQGCIPLCSDTPAVSTLPNCMMSMHNMALPVPSHLKNSSTSALSAGSSSFSWIRSRRLFPTVLSAAIKTTALALKPACKPKLLTTLVAALLSSNVPLMPGFVAAEFCTKHWKA